MARDIAVSSITSLIIGNGMGSYQLPTRNGLYHPHNIVLARFYDSGFIGLILFGAWITLTIWQRRPERLFVEDEDDETNITVMDETPSQPVR